MFGDIKIWPKLVCPINRFFIWRDIDISKHILCLKYPTTDMFRRRDHFKALIFFNSLSEMQHILYRRSICLVISMCDLKIFVDIKISFLNKNWESLNENKIKICQIDKTNWSLTFSAEKLFCDAIFSSLLMGAI
jgi:hypothetical protein